MPFLVHPLAQTIYGSEEVLGFLNRSIFRPGRLYLLWLRDIESPTRMPV